MDAEGAKVGVGDVEVEVLVRVGRGVVPGVGDGNGEPGVSAGGVGLVEDGAADVGAAVALGGDGEGVELVSRVIAREGHGYLAEGGLCRERGGEDVVREEESRAGGGGGHGGVHRDEIGGGNARGDVETLRHAVREGGGFHGGG